MGKRNFSLEYYWNKIAETRSPAMSFGSAGYTDWKTWRELSVEKLRSLMGETPKPVDLNAEVVYSIEDGDLIRERVIFDTEEFMSVPAQVLRPKEMKPDRSGAAIVCCNGHPAILGKDPVAGIASTPEHEEAIKEMNYDFGFQMAKNGFLTIMPELRGFGERRDGIDPFPGRDACNVNFIKGAIMGFYPMALNIWDVMRTIDYLQTRPEIDPQRIGMMGLSNGGTMTTFVSALDSRIKAADISGYVNPFSEFAVRRANFCGIQIVPEIYKYFDTHDIAGMIAPRPLIIEMGIYDECFYIHDLLAGYEGVRRIYEAAGAGEKLYKDIHPHAHSFAGGLAFDFFKNNL